MILLSVQVVIQTKANKLFLVVFAVFFDSSSQGTNSLSSRRFYSEEVTEYHFSLGASIDKTWFHVDRPFRIPWSTGERYYKDVWGSRLPFPFPFKTKNNFSNRLISTNALNVPSCPLSFLLAACRICGPDGITYIVMEHIPFVHYKCSLLVQIRLKARVHTEKIKVARGKFHGIPNESIE